MKSKLSKDEERTLTTDMRELYDRIQPTEASNQKRQKLVQKLEKLFNEEWPGHDIRVHMFGSSGNLLCTDDSDGQWWYRRSEIKTNPAIVDICITTDWKQLQDVCKIAELLAKSEHPESEPADVVLTSYQMAWRKSSAYPAPKFRL